MKVSISDVVTDSISAQFNLHLPDGANCSDVNRLRKIIMKEVPTWIIHSVDVQQNTSACYNEILSHRLSLIPMNWIGPADATDTIELCCVGDSSTLITSGDLRSYNNYATPVYSDMVICHLNKGQCIKLTAELRCGTGSESAKWSPVTNVTYKLLHETQSDLVYKMQLESAGGMSPAKIVEKAIAIYNNSC